MSQKISPDIDLSIVIPMLNEEENIKQLHQQIKEVLKTLTYQTEIIYINDGSTDSTLDYLREIANQDDRVRILDLRRNFRQTAALSAGFDYSSGEVIITMDGDLQNDPSDIPKLISKLQEGFDVVSGWRVDRKDSLLTRTIPSRIANWIIGKVTGIRLHDYGCSLKAYRGRVIREVKLYSGMHRFIPALASWIGASVTEIPVTHHRRKFGKTKYGSSRLVRVILDLITVKFMLSFSSRPFQFFGMGGFALFLSGSLILAIQLYRKLFWDGYDLADKPIVLAGIFLAIIGIQFISLGLLAELVVRTYHESQGKPIYVIREKYGRIKTEAKS